MSIRNMKWYVEFDVVVASLLGKGAEGQGLRKDSFGIYILYRKDSCLRILQTLHLVSHFCVLHVLQISD